jgi:hypothetical protein
MASTALADRHATAQEVREHARAIRKLVDRFGLSNARLRPDGTVVDHSDEAGYRGRVPRGGVTRRRCDGHLVSL